MSIKLIPNGCGRKLLKERRRGLQDELPVLT